MLDTRPVLSLVAQMEACEVRPNLRTFNTILRGCLRTGDTATAKAIWYPSPPHRALSGVCPLTLAVRDRLEVGPVKPDASSRDSMIKIYIQDGNLVRTRLSHLTSPHLPSRPPFLPLPFPTPL